jgi:putative acetyltransferase
MIELRPERPEDLAGIRAVHTAAFETPAEAGLVDALRETDAWVPELSVVAVESGRVVAHALLSRVVLATAGGEVPALAVGPVGVLPALQKQGYGSAVIRYALDRRDDHLVILLGSPDYYRRFGFVPGASHGITGPWSSSGAAWQVLPPATGTPAGEALFPAPWAAV